MNKGFTLIEMIVAMGVFSVAITIIMSAFLNITDLQKKALSVRATNDSVNFAMETMSREARTGRDYCADPCSSASFNFTSASGALMVYKLSGTQIEMSNDRGTNFSSLTPPEVEITALGFSVQGEGSGDGQPMVTIIIKSLSGTKTMTKSYLNLQTTVTQRKIDPNE